MAVNTSHLVEVMRRQVDAVDESVRVPEYRRMLLDSLAELILAEREHRQRATNINQRTTDVCETLGGKLHDAGWAG